MHGMTNTTIRNYRDLHVWQRALDLVLDVYAITSNYPDDERFALTTHTRKTSISIPSNIAEGCSRRQPVAYVNHLNIAMGSEGELGTQLIVGQRLGYVSTQRVETCLNELSEIGRMANGLASSIEASKDFQDALRGIRRPRK
jgi:four helix bundle protein